MHGSCRAREEHGYGSWRRPSRPASRQGHTQKLWALPRQGVYTQETNVSTRRHLQVPLSWKVPVSPCPRAGPMGRGGWLEGSRGSRAAPQKCPEGGRNSGGSWGGSPPTAGLRASSQAGATGAQECREESGCWSDSRCVWGILTGCVLSVGLDRLLCLTAEMVLVTMRRK